MQIDQNHLKLAFLFIASYAALYFLAMVQPLHNWTLAANPSGFDYMFLLFPVVGFFGVYFLIDWINEYYETTFAHSPAFPLLFLVLGIASFYVAVYWYTANIAQLSGRETVDFDFVALLLDSAMLVFLLSGVLGWASKMVMERSSHSTATVPEPKKASKK